MDGKGMSYSKYRAQKTVVDGIVFDSKKEAKRYGELKLLEKAGEITDLATQWPLELQAAFTDNQGNKQRAINYVADFWYFDKKKKKWIIEDVKGVRTTAYIMKRKMVLYFFQNDPSTIFLET